MKIKVLGMTVFELQRDPPALHPDKPSGPRAVSAKPRCPAPAAVSPPLRPLADLHAAGEFLPRTSRGTLDVNATLRLFGLKDASVLWQQKYPTGSAGAALKRALGALGRKPALPPRRIRQDPEGGGSAAKQAAGTRGRVHAPGQTAGRPNPVRKGCLGGRKDPGALACARRRRAHRYRCFPPDAGPGDSIIPVEWQDSARLAGTRIEEGNRPPLGPG